MTASGDPWEMLEATSRTFYVPIVRLPDPLKMTVGSAYLCMRAIDQIEDSDAINAQDKASLLRGIHGALADYAPDLAALEALLSKTPYEIEPVTQHLSHYAGLADPAVAPLIWRSTAEMAESMAGWVERDWHIASREDLEQYTFDVAGRVGLLLNRLWRWHDGTVADDALAIGFGRGLQAVNILRNREEDARRGVSFYPPGWSSTDLFAFINHQLELAQQYLDALPRGPAYDFCILPYELAKATAEAITEGKEKLSREDVLKVVARCN